MKKIFFYFLQGLILVAPFGITIYIVVLIFRFFNNLISGIFGDLFPFNIPGFGILVVFFAIALLGLLARTVIARPLRYMWTRFLDKAPLVKLIYSSLKDLMNAFVGKEKKFNRPVRVKVNLVSDLEKLGFLTQEDLSQLGIEGQKVAVYFPHSYNFSGEMFIVPVEHVTPLDASASEVMKFIVSGGAAGFSGQ
jgi:uncharacterized membrane protein